MNPGKLVGGLVGVFIALAGPALLIGAGMWWGVDRPAWHVGWCPVCLGWNAGAGAQLKALQDAEKAAAAHSARVVAAQSAVTVQAAQHEAAAQVQIRTVYRTLHDEVPTYVPPAADAQCVVPVGFVRLHDAGAAGVRAVPDPAGQPDDAPSGLALSAVAATVVDNYGAAVANAEQLKALQDWVVTEQKAGN